MKKAFTLIELLVVIAIIALLMGVLVPVLSAARSQARGVFCSSNLRQLILANAGYATEHHGRYVPAAADIMNSNLKRWHGQRDNKDEPFDLRRSPLVSYLGDGQLKECPAKVNFRKGDPWDYNFEDGCGGFGYNRTYIGSRTWQGNTSANCRMTTRDTEVGRPANTVMFADTAMAKTDTDGPYYLEYSFIQTPYFLTNGRVVKSWGLASPSIHFRHRGRANIGWVDGHITSEEMLTIDHINAYGVSCSEMLLGWFDKLDNSPYDLR